VLTWQYRQLHRPANDLLPLRTNDLDSLTVKGCWVKGIGWVYGIANVVMAGYGAGDNGVASPS
jgi:hypothetical protein